WLTCSSRDNMQLDSGRRRKSPSVALRPRQYRVANLMPTELVLAKIGSAVGSLVLSAVKKKVEYHTEHFTTRRRIKRRLDDAVDKITESLGEFLEAEHICDQKIEILLLEAKTAIKPLLKKPDAFFAGSLTGRKIFEQLYPKREDLPQAI